MRLYRAILYGICVAHLLSSCSLPQTNAGKSAAKASDKTLDAVLGRDFVLDVMSYVYRWHFDQSYVLEAGDQDTLQVWGRILNPNLDEGDRSQFAELWIPAVKVRVELKRSDYDIPELSLQVRDRDFKVTRVTRQSLPPGPQNRYKVENFDLNKVQEHLFATRSEPLPLSPETRKAGRALVLGFLAEEHPGDFTQDQVFYVAPVSPVCNHCWVFWETGRKVMFFSADMDLSNAGASALGQLKMQVIDLDKDIVASPREVMGSNAFVTKDWVGRLFFNCILYGERVVWTPQQIQALRAGARSN